VNAASMNDGAPERFIYGETVNLTLLEHVDPGPRVLDIGCGAGAWSEALRARGAKHLVGVEVSPAAADLAAARYDRVLSHSVEQLSLPSVGPEIFDTIIVADVI
jgi:cyclopropane fatty-acyl-phospholipid synthase-like methyltransferase